MSFRVAIVGRPNVGKSTLFNRLAGKKLAIVDNTPGVTRDRKESKGSLGDLNFNLIDTAGFESFHGESLEARMGQQTNRAIDLADVVLFLIDSRAGITPLDTHFSKWLRGRDVQVILVANKCEGSAGEGGLYDAYSLGLGEPLALSAEHGEGMAELYQVLRPIVDAKKQLEQAPPDDTDHSVDMFNFERKEELTGPLRMAIVGRPNVGKSTLVNQLIGEDRLLTGGEAGTTRDSISIEWSHNGRPISLVDTAGLRRKSKVTEKLEMLSANDSHRAIQFAQLVVLLLDGRTMLEKQDLTIARQIIDEGRVLIIGVNKWDSVKDQKAARNFLSARLSTSLPQVRGVPIVYFSALTGDGIQNLLPNAFKYFDIWNKRIPTGKLNHWLEMMTEQHPPPLVRGRRLRLRYITQAKTRPPTFILFSSRGKSLPEAYRRYIANGLREDFELPGIPIRVMSRSSNNPYDPK